MFFSLVSYGRFFFRKEKNSEWLIDIDIDLIEMFLVMFELLVIQYKWKIQFPFERTNRICNQ